MANKITDREILRRCRCGACHGPLGQFLNVVMLDYYVSWAYPRWGNVLTGEDGYANAFVCVEEQAEIHEVVEFRNGGFVYHPLETLTPVPPVPPPYAMKTDGLRSGIECLTCRQTSWHIEHVQHKFCPTCNHYHED